MFLMYIQLHIFQYSISLMLCATNIIDEFSICLAQSRIMTVYSAKYKLDYSWDKFPVYFGVFKSLRYFSCLLRCF